MSDHAPSPLITFRVRATVLWRESRWHCECGYASSHWIANLYHDDVIVAEWVVDTVNEMLRIAEHWHMAVKSRDAGTHVPAILIPTRGRRETVKEEGSDSKRPPGNLLPYPKARQ